MPFNWFEAGYEINTVFLWFEIELLVFSGTILSTILFLAMRSCIRHKIQKSGVKVS